MGRDATGLGVVSGVGYAAAGDGTTMIGESVDGDEEDALAVARGP